MKSHCAVWKIFAIPEFAHTRTRDLSSEVCPQSTLWIWIGMMMMIDEYEMKNENENRKKKSF